MIAQILATRRSTPLDGCREIGGEPTRGLDLAARIVQIGLALALLPALATMVAVGLVGASVYAVATTAARVAGLETGPTADGSEDPLTF